MVLFEAMATRVPIVAASVGGVPDTLTDADALLVKPETAVALADALKQVHDDPTAARNRADAAEIRLRTHFGVEPWLERYDAVYDVLVRARPLIQTL